MCDTIHLNNPFSGPYYYIDDVNVHCCSCDSLDHTGVNELSKKSDLFRLYPNPNNGEMQLDYKLNEGDNGELIIMDVTGRIVVKYNLAINQNTLYISQTILNNGVYLYQVLTNGNITHTDKLIIVK